MNVMRELRDEQERMREEYERALAAPAVVDSGPVTAYLTERDMMFLRAMRIAVDSVGLG
jgi:hypothetical protein